ncbi:uncharacterized protein LOC143037377 [Oratosquilla oratoria]|uniref:uncharacterized protein LOC143037377 n=1 Tax=Oratosquilla oratoria TaxID=337810 RepID=UPI003F767869
MSGGALIVLKSLMRSETRDLICKNVNQHSLLFDRCSKWIQVTGISTLRKKTPTQLNKSQRICSHHFSQRQYASSTRLCPSAYPDQNLPDPAHPDEPEITSMDADIDLHLDTASTLHHQQIEMEILSSSLDENFG